MTQQQIKVAQILATAARRLFGRVTAGSGPGEEIVLDTDGTLAANSDDIVASQKAVKTYVDAHGGGGITWTVITGDQTAVINNGYICNKPSLLTLTLPAAAAAGSVIRVAGMNAGLWKVAQGAGQQIHFGNKDTTSGAGGYVASVLTRDSVELLCVVANNEWQIISSVGNLTVA
jgi:hypothetical protein